MKTNQYLLYLVTDSELVERKAVPQIVHSAIMGGVTMVQVRDKKATTREFCELAKAVQAVTKAKQIPLIINDRLDIALAIDADGLHIGQSDMPYPVARQILGKEKLIGLSVSTLAQVREANQWGLDYIGLGPIFTTATKAGVPALGIERAEQIVQISRHTTVGIGGIDYQNAGEVITTGANGVAVVSAIMASKDPFAASQRIYHAVKSTIKNS